MKMIRFLTAIVLIMGGKTPFSQGGVVPNLGWGGFTSLKKNLVWSNLTRTSPLKPSLTPLEKNQGGPNPPDPPPPPPLSGPMANNMYYYFAETDIRHKLFGFGRNRIFGVKHFR